MTRSGGSFFLVALRKSLLQRRKSNSPFDQPMVEFDQLINP